MIGWALLAAILAWNGATCLWERWRDKVVAGWCWRCGSLLPVKLFDCPTGRCPAGGYHEKDAEVTREELRRQRVPGRG